MSTLFRSTRDLQGTSPVGFREALFRGLAPDGGLYQPVLIPGLPEQWQAAASFPDLAELVLTTWLGDAGLGHDRFVSLVHDAFSFPVPLTALSDDRWLLELHHGPTLAFKDFGARFMARIMDALLADAGEKLTIVVATSGDTGSAVADGFAGLRNTDVVLLYPQGRVSPLQELQLTVRRPGVRTLAVAGTFDDCQRMAKEVLADDEVRKLGVSSANSINIGRLLPQQLYYLWAVKLLAGQGVTALATEPKADRQPAPLFSVPSGNLGNLTAGVMAALSGARIQGFIAAHNANDWFPRWLSGQVTDRDFPATVQTLSNAMDVGAPSNFERLEAFGEPARRLVSGQGFTDSATLAAIARTAQEDGLLVCPHTAVGLQAVNWHRSTSEAVPTVVLATAHAAKFPEVVSRAVPGADLSHPGLEPLKNAETAGQSIAADTAALKQFLLD